MPFDHGNEEAQKATGLLESERNWQRLGVALRKIHLDQPVYQYIEIPPLYGFHSARTASQEMVSI